jgi:thioredoxin 2
MQIVCPHCGATNRVPDNKVLEHPKCGQCHEALLPGIPVVLDDQHLPHFVAATGLPVVVDFWASWCAPCRAMAPVFTKLAGERPDIQFVKVDTDACPTASARHAIRSIPTLILFQNGVERARLSGALPYSELRQWLDTQLNASTGR